EEGELVIQIGVVLWNFTPVIQRLAKANALHLNVIAAQLKFFLYCGQVGGMLCERSAQKIGEADQVGLCRLWVFLDERLQHIQSIKQKVWLYLLPQQLVGRLGIHRLEPEYLDLRLVLLVLVQHGVLCEVDDGIQNDAHGREVHKHAPACRALLHHRAGEGSKNAFRSKVLHQRMVPQQHERGEHVARNVFGFTQPVGVVRYLVVVQHYPNVDKERGGKQDEDGHHAGDGQLKLFVHRVDDKRSQDEEQEQPAAVAYQVPDGEVVVHTGQRYGFFTLKLQVTSTPQRHLLEDAELSNPDFQYPLQCSLIIAIHNWKFVV